MNLRIFTLFLIWGFLTGTYVCYNLFVANTITKITLLQQQLLDLSQDLVKELTIDVTSLTREGERELEQSIIYNEQSLEELLVDTATEQDYETYVGEVVKIVQDLYKNYQFLRQDPAENDYQSGYFLAFQIIRAEYPVEYENLFRMAVGKGLDERKINKMFVEKVQNGEVLALGDCKIDSTGTGMSSILQAMELRVNITFAPTAYFEKKEAELEELKEKRAKQLAEQQEQAKEKDNALKSIRVACAVLDKLVDSVAEKHEMTTLVEQIKESMGYL